MKIDITKLNQNIVDKINIMEEVVFPCEYLAREDDIKGLENVLVKGKIYNSGDESISLELLLTGVMKLEDTISLELRNYPFSIEILENLEKNGENFENTLDILDILWQNIVLEVPLRFTEISDYSSFSGEGWKLLSEEDVKSSNNPFEELKSMFGKE